MIDIAYFIFLWKNQGMNLNNAPVKDVPQGVGIELTEQL